jgi:dTDP-glucose 4,6-dehydratase
MKNRRDPRTVLVTGGAGFIGGNLIRWLFEKGGFSGRIVNLDLLTYAGNPAGLADVVALAGDSRYRFVRGDIGDADLLDRLFAEESIDTVVHLAAESHVDRSIHGPAPFVTTNVVGTLVLLEAARRAWADRTDVLFHHVSTDEVFGSLGQDGFFCETTAYDPRSPYSASKAASDHLVRAWAHTYGLPVTISNCSNNYGPFQFPEKLIPLMIMNMLEGKTLPVYGDGKNVRDWLYVDDHASAIWSIVRHAEPGRTWLVGGENEWENLTLVRHLAGVVAREAGMDEETILSSIEFVGDRPGHDRRYAIDCSRIRTELGWKQSVDFAEGLARTVRWYLSRRDWVDSVRSGAYREWIEQNYAVRIPQ